MTKLHSADIEPAGNRVDHVLVINGAPAARFHDLKKAIAARQLVVEQAINTGRGQMGRTSRQRDISNVRHVSTMKSSPKTDP